MPKFQKKTTEPKKVPEDDIWDDIENTVGGGGGYQDENGFDKTSTNFYVKKGETLLVVMTSESPKLIPVHGLVKQITTKAGKSVPIYPNETCQKPSQPTCVLCEESITNKSVRSRSNSIIWDLVSLSGVRNGGDFTEEAAAQFFENIPKALAFELKKIKDELAEDKIKLTEVVIEITKSGSNTSIGMHTEKVGKGIHAVHKPVFVSHVIERDDKGNAIKSTITDLDTKDVIFDGALPDRDFIWKPKSNDALFKELNDTVQQ